jgi:hypothetical protein
MLNLKCVSAAPLTSRSRYDVPDAKVVSNRDPASSYVLVPLIKQLSRVGGPVDAASTGSDLLALQSMERRYQRVSEP